MQESAPNHGPDHRQNEVANPAQPTQDELKRGKNESAIEAYIASLADEPDLEPDDATLADEPDLEPDDWEQRSDPEPDDWPTDEEPLEPDPDDWLPAEAPDPEDCR
jgi:hypothetical protein